MAEEIKTNEIEETKGATKPEGNPEEESQEKTYTQAELDEIIKQRLSRERSKSDKELAKQLEEAKKEAEKLAAMNEKQKVEYELEKLRAENEELKANQAVVEMTKVANQMFKDKGYDATEDMLAFVVADSAEATKDNIEKFVAIIQSQVKASQVERATGKTPKTYKENTGVTRASIEAVTDRAKRQQLIRENMDLFT